MKKLFILILITNIIYSQDKNKFQFPKSQDAYLFEKYGCTPVSKYTGRPDINIPLYTIEIGDTKIPLSLNYNSNGIRVDEESGPVGLGWYFGTGMISQIVQGKDDLKNDMAINYLDYYWAPYPQYVVAPNPYWWWQTQHYNTAPNDSPLRINFNPSTPDPDKYFMARVRQDIVEGGFTYYPKNSQLTLDCNLALSPETNADLQLDFFKANFFGYDITFCKYPNSNQFFVLDNQKFQISSSYVENVFGEYVYKWVIVAPNGNTYYFDEEDRAFYVDSAQWYSPNLQYTGNTGYASSMDIQNSDNLFFNPNTCSRIWKLTKIVDAKSSKQINFEYSDSPVIYSSSGINTQCEFLNVTEDALNPFVGVIELGPYDGPDFSESPQYHPYSFPVGKQTFMHFNSSSILKQEKSILTKITFGDYKLELNYSDRLDITGDKKLDNILLKRDSQVIKSINLNFDYFENGSTDNNQKRLKLISLQKDGQLSSFEYNPTPLPNKNSFSFDYWGYYNGMPNTTPINNPFRLYQNQSHIPSWAKTFLPQIEGKANRSAHPTYCKAGILEKITYPTGGYTIFEYELNEFDNYFFPDYNNKIGVSSANTYITDFVQTKSHGFGLRVKKTIDFNSDVEYYEKDYTYEGGKHIPAYEAPIDSENYFSVYYLTSFDGAPNTSRHTCSGQKILSYSSSIYQTQLLGNGDFVGYSKVNEELKSQNNNSNGKSSFFYSNSADTSPRQKFGFGVPDSYFDLFGGSIASTHVINGSLLKKQYFNSNMNLIKEVENTYESYVPNLPYKYNIKVASLPGKYGCLNNPNDQDYGGPNQFLSVTEYLFFYYPIQKTRTLLTSEIVKEYFGSNTVTSSTLFEYDHDLIHNPNLELTTKTTTNSTGETLKTIYEYPFSSGVINEPYIDDLQLLNRCSTIMKTTQLKDSEILSVEKTVYDSHYMPVAEYSQKGSDASNLEERISYQRDNLNNIIQYKTVNGKPVSVIWGYNRTQPIAVIENIKYDSLPAQLMTAAVQASNTSVTGMETNLINALKALRDGLPNNMVTTYTYVPLVGICIVTDPKGFSTRYEYDDFGRLSTVYDSKNQRISANQYHFKTQN